MVAPSVDLPGMKLADILSAITETETKLIPVLVPAADQGLAAVAFVAEQTLFSILLAVKGSKTATTTPTPATPATPAAEPSDFVPAGVPSAHAS
ncbi:MAG: hypothetical protein JO061_03625 [Acidobacteriaceae bacterium]|nr:hypothetical protein [Acidobacteriaceae bacterium]